MWALRAGYVGLVVAVVGLVVMSLGSTSWFLAVGVFTWLGAVTVTATGFLWTRHDLREPRPRYWSMRLLLIHDSVHSKASSKRS